MHSSDEPNLAWWRAIGEWLSFDRRSAEEREAFSRMFNLSNAAAMVILFVMFSVQGIMTKKERARIGGLDASLVE